VVGLVPYTDRAAAHMTASDVQHVPPGAPDADPHAPRPLDRTRWRHLTAATGVPLIASAAGVTALVTRLHASFLINDDATLSSLVNGDYTGRRTSSLVVAGTMFGRILRVGYAISSRLPWYGIVLYVLLILCLAAIGTVAFTLSRRPSLAERLLVAATIVLIAPWLILRVSFTPVSLMLGGVGILVFATAARYRGWLGTTAAGVAGILLGASYLIRAYSFLGVLIAFAPVCVAIAVRAGLRLTLTFALTIGVLVAVGVASDRLEYSRSGTWNSFMQGNAARSALQSTPRLDDAHVSDRDLQRIGWTRNDLHLFAQFVYPDSHVYSSQAIRELARLSPRVRTDFSVRSIFDALRRPVVAPLILVGIVLVAVRRNRTLMLVSLGAFVWLVGVLVALLLYVRLPDRVLIPLEAEAVLMLAIVPSYLVGASPRFAVSARWQQIAVAAVASLALAATVSYGAVDAARVSRDNGRTVGRKTHAIAALKAYDAKGVFIARGDEFGQWSDPFSATSPFATLRLIPLGWATNSPLFTARLKRLGITDLYSSLVSDRHMYLLGNADLVTEIEQYYREHRGLDVLFQPSRKQILGLTVWAASVVPPPASGPSS
jgi:hypothetical protein